MKNGTLNTVKLLPSKLRRPKCDSQYNVKQNDNQIQFGQYLMQNNYLFKAIEINA